MIAVGTPSADNNTRVTRCHFNVSLIFVVVHSFTGREKVFRVSGAVSVKIGELSG
jgi:hypothetical protein